MTFHVIGAGLAGLSAALALSRRGRGAEIIVYEAGREAGGRCRSWHDTRLAATIDNGTHVVVGANRAVRDYLGAIDASDRLHWFTDGIPFIDLADATRWRVRGPLDFATLARRRGGGVRDELAAALRLAAPRGAPTIGARLGRDSMLAAALWQPLARAVMNADPAGAAAAPFARVLRRTLLRGAGAMRVAVARDSLEHCFIAPALACLRRAGAELRFEARIEAILAREDAVTGLAGGGGTINVGARDRVIAALPPWELGRLLPEHAVPWAASPIINLHVRLPADLAADVPRLYGIVGGSAEWVLTRGPVASATVSAGEQLLEPDAETIARLLWPDMARALDAPAALPAAWRVVKERRATPLQDPAFERRRPGVVTRRANLLLAGDWVEPGLPCTIETAIASGARAARRALTGA